MSDQDDRQATGLQRPVNDDKEAWQDYWKAQGQPWRTEPEINTERQKYLEERRQIIPDIERGIYPFKDMKLNRADIEWLLATHENGQGPIDWSDKSQRGRKGLDLRGADLQKINLSGLPLAGLIGGLTGSAWFHASPEQCEMAAVHMQGALLIQTQLAGAKLNQAYLERTNLFRSNLEQAELRAASLKRAYLNETNLGGALFRRAHLEGAWLTRAPLVGASTPPADLRGAFFDNATALQDITLANTTHACVQLADVSWGGVNLSRIDWSTITILGDEFEARQLRDRDNNQKDRQTRFNECDQAVRANRQLATALRDQGLNEFADRFAYRAQKMQQYRLLLELLKHPVMLALIPKVSKKSRQMPFSDSLLNFIFIFLSFCAFILLIAVQVWPLRIIFLLGIVVALWWLFSSLLLYKPGSRLILVLVLSIVLNLLLLLGIFTLLIVVFTYPELLLLIVALSLSIPVLLLRFTIPFWARDENWIIEQWNKIKKYSLVHKIQALFLSFTKLQIGLGKYTFSLLLDLIAGYGYKPGRSLIAYSFIIVIFAASYNVFGGIARFPDSLVFSLTSFHGRGFFPTLSWETNLHNPLVVLAAIEAVIGLFIEISLIATFTQRYLGK